LKPNRGRHQLNLLNNLMKLFLVRHGETKENETSVLMGHYHGILTEKGKEQAKETAMLLKDKKFDHIYSSDLNHCVDTAEIIKEFNPDTPLTFTKELRERNFGILQGLITKEIDWLKMTGDAKGLGKPEGGESIDELKIRALDFLRKIYEQHPQDTILFITHNGWIKQILSHYTGTHSADIPKVANAQVIEVEVGVNLTGSILNLENQNIEERYVKIIIEDENQKILKHHYIRENKWDVPAGKIEVGETVLKGAIRELIERTGYIIEDANLQTMPKEEKFFVFKGNKKDLVQVARPGEKGGYITEIRWD